MTKKKSELKDERISIRLDKATLNALTEEAKKQGRELGSYVRFLLMTHPDRPGL